MAPKAKAKVKAKAKAKAKALAMVRHPRLHMRRPAVAGARPAAAVPRTLQGLSSHEMGSLNLVWLKKASYYGKEVDVVGYVRGVKIEGGNTFLQLQGTGTKDDGILRALTATEDRKLLVHVCSPGCDGALTGESLIHGKEFEEVNLDQEPWFSNAMKVDRDPAGEVDEMEALRRAADQPLALVKEGSPETPKTKKKKKKAKLAKEKEVERKRQTLEAEDVAGDERGQAALSAVFGGSGLDPIPKVRNSLMKKARRNTKKKKKKKKDSSDDSGTSTSSSSSSSLGGEGAAGLFESERRLRTIHRKYPGVLTCRGRYPEELGYRGRHPLGFRQGETPPSLHPVREAEPHWVYVSTYVAGGSHFGLRH